MAAPTRQEIAAANQFARAAIRANAIKMEQVVAANTFTAPSGVNISNVQPVFSTNGRNVGLIRGFWVKVVATVDNGSAVAIDLTDWGPANLLSQIQFQDLNNNTRIQTTGRHIAAINSIRSRRPFGTSLVRTTGFDSPMNFGSNWIDQISAPAQIAAGDTGVVTMWYYVPISYSDDDLRGAMYAAVLNGTMQLNLTFNPIPVVANGTDSLGAVYVGDAGGSVALAVISDISVEVTQCYFEQIPTTKNGVLLPIVDISTIYELKNTVLTGITANQDFPIQYANYRDFLSLFVTYTNDPSSGARGVGADINFWALQSANFTNIWKKSPGLIATQNRNMLSCDFPPGVYYFGTRDKPINTNQYGNMQVILNSNTAAAQAYVEAYFEDFAFVQNLSGAGSLAAS